MAKFTRSEIRKILGENCTDEIENQLVALHLGVVDPLKDDAARYKADAERLADVQKELDELKSKGDDGFKAKYESEHKAFEDYKKTVDAEKADAAKEKAVEAVLKKIGIADKRLQSVAKLAKADGLLDALELDDNGAVKDSDKLEKSLKDSYSEYVTKSGTKGADTATPPANSNGAVMSRAEIAAIKDRDERRAEYAKLIAAENNDE